MNIHVVFIYCLLFRMCDKLFIMKCKKLTRYWFFFSLGSIWCADVLLFYVSCYLLFSVRRYDNATTCGLVWTANFVAYRCRTCGISPCMSLCAQCFQVSIFCASIYFFVMIIVGVCFRRFIRNMEFMCMHKHCTRKIFTKLINFVYKPHNVLRFFFSLNNWLFLPYKVRLFRVKTDQ